MVVDVLVDVVISRDSFLVDPRWLREGLRR
jgi:hypothetical protein